MVFHRRSAALALLALAALGAAAVPPAAVAQPAAPPATPTIPMLTPAPAQSPPARPGMMTPAPAMTPALMSPAPGVTPTAAASPGTSPSPADMQNPPENPLVTARVRGEFLAWQHGRIARATYSPTAGGTYIDAYVSVVAPDLAIGDIQTVRYRTASLLLGDLVYRYDVTGTNGAVSVLYALDGRGKTDGIFFTPEVFRAAANTP